MEKLDSYKQQLFTFNDPIFFAFILSVVILVLLVVVYVKIIYPLQKKLVTANQRYLLERAELMALFAEMDPDPLLRIDIEGFILQSNEAARKLFGYETFEKMMIQKILPLKGKKIGELPVNWIQDINGRIFNIITRRGEKLGFTNIYLHDITTIKLYERELEIYKGNLKTLTLLLDKQSEDLKKSIASQLHDDIGQRLMLLILKVGQFAKYGTENIMKDLEYIAQNIRDISHKLVPINIKELGIIYNIRKIVDEISTASYIEGTLETIQNENDFEKYLSDEEKLLLLNGVQEGLNNVIKHSEASLFVVSLFMDENFVELSIADNGKGIVDGIDKNVLEPNSGIGLFRLRERVHGFNGELNIRRNEIYSTILEIKLPRGK